MWSELFSLLLDGKDFSLFFLFFFLSLFFFFIMPDFSGYPDLIVWSQLSGRLLPHGPCNRDGSTVLLAAVVHGSLSLPGLPLPGEARIHPSAPGVRRYGLEDMPWHCSAITWGSAAV